MMHDDDISMTWRLNRPIAATIDLHMNLGVDRTTPGDFKWLELPNKAAIGEGNRLYMEFKLAQAFVAVNGTSGNAPSLLLGVAYSDRQLTQANPANGNLVIPLWSGCAIRFDGGGSDDYDVVRGLVAGGGGTAQNNLGSAAVGRCFYMPIEYPSPILGRNFDSGQSHEQGQRRSYMTPVCAVAAAGIDHGSSTDAFSAGYFECRVIQTPLQAEAVESDGSLRWGRTYPSSFSVK